MMIVRRKLISAMVLLLLGPLVLLANIAFCSLTSACVLGITGMLAALVALAGLLLTPIGIAFGLQKLIFETEIIAERFRTLAVFLVAVAALLGASLLLLGCKGGHGCDTFEPALILVLFVLGLYFLVNSIQRRLFQKKQ